MLKTQITFTTQRCRIVQPFPIFCFRSMCDTDIIGIPDSSDKASDGGVEACGYGCISVVCLDSGRQSRERGDLSVSVNFQRHSRQYHSHCLHHGPDSATGCSRHGRVSSYLDISLLVSKKSFRYTHLTAH